LRWTQAPRENISRGIAFSLLGPVSIANVNIKALRANRARSGLGLYGQQRPWCQLGRAPQYRQAWKGTRAKPSQNWQRCAGSGHATRWTQAPRENISRGIAFSLLGPASIANVNIKALRANGRARGHAGSSASTASILSRRTTRSAAAAASRASGTTRAARRSLGCARSTARRARASIGARTRATESRFGPR
jgi:hypothetical protein